MNLVLVNRFEVDVVRRHQDGVGDVFAKNLGDSLCDTFFDANCFEAEEVLSVGFFLGVAVGCDFWFNGADVGADEIGGHL